MPFKHNAARRHYLPKARSKLRNWRPDEAGLRQRGRLTLWITDDASAGWRAAPRPTPGGQALFSDVAIETMLTLGTVQPGSCKDQIPITHLPCCRWATDGLAPPRRL